MKIRIALANILFGAVLTAQAVRNHEVPLKNWPAPLYWQPTRTEALAIGMKPELQPAPPQVATGPLVFVAMTPCRVVDTRASQHFPDPFGAPGLSPGAARTFTIQTSTLCSIPTTAQAYSFNVTVIPPGALGFLTIYPHGQSQPNAVTLDDLLGAIENNAYAASNTIDTGSENTATGYAALIGNTSGNYNRANLFGALSSNIDASVLGPLVRRFPTASDSSK